jgi:SPP1 gp7 family putative phage head morphogenesis protein
VTVAHKHIHTFNQSQYDPTHTTVLRDQFSREMAKRFRALRGIIREAVVTQDCFGLMNSSSASARLGPPVLTLAAYAAMTPPGWRAFDFPRSADKVQAFMDWLKRQEDIGVLETTTRTQLGVGAEEAWTNKYIWTVYQKGLVRARNELRAAGYKSRAGEEIPELDYEGAIDVAFNMPQHADRAGLIYQRVYEDLKGITSQMDTQISRVLSQAMLDGKHPYEIAKLLTKTISGPMGNLGITDTLGRFIPAERRAKILARTEVIRSFHLANVQEMRNWGVAGVKVKAEWQTAGDPRVCEQCASLQGKVFTLDEIEKKIPLHPQCRCVALPLEVTDDKEDTING